MCSASILGSRLKAWNTNPIIRFRMKACSSSVRSPTDLPSRAYLPAVGVSRQPRMFIRVDFPDPDRPITATYSPRLMVADTPRSAGMRPSPIGKDLCNPSMEIRDGE